MPYASTKELPAPVRAKLKGKKLRQWLHVWNSSYDRHGDESRAFAEAWATVKKANAMSEAEANFTFFMPISKINKDKRTVSGYASTPTKDSDGEIVTLEAVKKALPDYMNWRNIREMHALKAVGTAEEANMDPRGLFLTARIVDESAWQKCLEGVYKGFSIGGRKLAKDGDKITKLEMTEISVVDRPANPDCKISLAKSAKAEGAEGYLLRKKDKLDSAPIKDPPAAHDGFSLPAKSVPKPVENLSPRDNTVENNKANDGGVVEEKTVRSGDVCKDHGVENCPKCAAAKRDVSTKERERLAGTGAALPDGSFPIANVSDLKNAIRAIGRAKNPGRAKAHIKRRARALGATALIPEGWSKAAKRRAELELHTALGLGPPPFLDLKKGMRTVGNLSYCFDSLRDAQRSLMIEGKNEGGDSRDAGLAKKLGSIANELAGVISQKASHEAEEALDMSDSDDRFVNSLLEEDEKMATAKTEGGAAVAVSGDNSHGDPLTDALATLVKRAAAPTKGQRLSMAYGNMKDCRKAMKECRKAIEDAHAMHKAAFLSKAAKGKKPANGEDDDDEEFDHTGAMEKLQKAYGELEKARTFGKAALGNLAKGGGVSGRTGQRGQEVDDAEGKFYEVPPGLRALTPADLSSASPGGPTDGAVAPLYPDDGGVYPGKAAPSGDLAKFVKNGQISAEVVELLIKGAKAEAELAALKKLPAVPSGGRRPFTFDLTKVTAGGGENRELGSILFDGVDTNAIGSGDERAHTEASARVLGNLLTSGHFGKSVFDPNFKGAAGSGRGR